MTTIRIIPYEEATAFWTLRLEALRQHPTAFGSSWEEAKDTTDEGIRDRLQNDDNGFVLGAYQDNRLVGMIGFKRGTSIKERHKAFVWGMYVASSHRGQGIGRLLMEEVIQRATAMNGLEIVTLSVVTTNTGALKLYRSLGFVTYGTEPCALRVDGECLDEAHMAYRISAAPWSKDHEQPILEAALLSILPGRKEEFEASFIQASAIIAGMRGYLGHELRACVEDDHKYLLLVHWESLEDHTVGFRESSAYQEWKSLLHHYYDPFPVVEHFHPNLLPGTKRNDKEEGSPPSQ
jgi:ribosomal protein S18 acetylase RimI-like enzyme/heme-degrading monooxygenase HmoA